MIGTKLSNSLLKEEPLDKDRLEASLLSKQAGSEHAKFLGHRNSWHRSSLRDVDLLSDEVVAWDLENMSDSQEKAKKGCSSTDTVLLEKNIPETTQDMLHTAACLGSFDKVLLAAILGIDIPQVMEQAVERGVVVWDGQQECYLFFNAETECAVYGLIDNKRERALHHLALGRRLTHKLSSQELEDNYYVILRQFLLGRSQITSESESNAIAALCLRAGSKAVSESDFVAASNYLDFGISLLTDDHWKTDYDLSLTLYNAAAEVEYCNAKYDRTDAYISEIMKNARCYGDTLHASATRVYSLGSRYKMADALTEGLAVLEHLGQKFPSHPRMVHAALDFVRTKRLLRNKTNEMILRMPLMTDPDMIATVHMLNLLFLCAYQTNPTLYVLLVMRLVRLTVQHGLSAVSSVGFSVYATMVCSLSRTKDEGYGYGQLSLALLEKFQAKEWLPRVYLTVYGNTYTYKHPLSESIIQLSRAHSVGMESGDIEFAMLAANVCIFFQLSSGNPLPLVEEEAMVFYNQMVSHKLDSALLLMRPGLQLIHNLRGKNDTPLRLHGKMWSDEADITSVMETKDELSVGFFYFHLVLLSFIFHDFEATERHAKRLETLIHPPYLHPGLACLLLFRGLAAVASSRSKAGLSRKRLLSVGRRCLKQLRAYSQLTPNNCTHKANLLEAEVAAAMGKPNVARRMFSYAVSDASKVNDLLVLSVACERTARFMLEYGDESSANEYFRQSHSSYVSWGADAKAAALESELPGLNQLSKGTVQTTALKVQ